MYLTYEYAEYWLKKLKENWMNKNWKEAASLFKNTTYYQETPFMKAYTNYLDIEKEWMGIENQEIKSITFTILAIEKNTMIVHWNFKRNIAVFDGIYEIKFNDKLECIYFKSWEMEE